MSENISRALGIGVSGLALSSTFIGVGATALYRGEHGLSTQLSGETAEALFTVGLVGLIVTFALASAQLSKR